MSPTTIEEFHQLRKNIFATKAPRSLQLMLVVSSRHGEGATTTTALLGSTMAPKDRPDLCRELRTPGLSRIFGAWTLPASEALTNDPAGASFYHPTGPTSTSCRQAASCAAALCSTKEAFGQLSASCGADRRILIDAPMR